MRTRVIFIGISLVIILLSSVFTVNEREHALILQFGEFVRNVQKPGLAFKIPLIQEVKKYSKMVLHLHTDDKELITAEQKRIIINAYAKYHITEPLRFYRSVFDEATVRKRLNDIFESSLRQVIAGIYLSDLLSTKRSDIMLRTQELVNSEAKKLGVNVIDAHILRAELPEENSNAIYRRMQTDREKEAREFRAQGAEEAARIKAEADKKVDILLAEALKQSELTKSAGDKSAYNIYATYYGLDPEFFGFYRSLQAYRTSFKPDNTTIILSPENTFLKIFNGK